jgi:hypothetical protein
MMRSRESEVLVGRRYLEHGFLDPAMRLFARNAVRVTAADWTRLAERLMERDRIFDVVQVCTLGGVQLPREQLLARGDDLLRRKDVDGAIYFFELAEADRERWSRLVDVLTQLPDRDLRAIDIAERHLVDDDEFDVAPFDEARAAAAAE